MADQPTVRKGQLWQDLDWRVEGREPGYRSRRLLLVVAVDGVYADVHAWHERLKDFEWHRRTEPRPSRIRLDRLGPTSTGYRLLADAPGEESHDDA